MQPRAPGVNLVGYHHVDSGLGEIARSLSQSFRDAGVAVNDIAVTATDSPVRGEPPQSGELYSTTVAVVTALQLPAVAELYPEPFAPDLLRVGYWFWELEVVPADQAPAFELVDVVWAPSTFVRDAYLTAGDTPVELHPPYLPEPVPSSATRAELGMPDGLVLLTSFDYLSGVERKAPLRVVTAFREAFPDRDDIALMIKTINGNRKPAAARTVRDFVGDDPRIALLDRHLPAADQSALIAHADVLVSLHRGEGLGLHIAEAMQLATPVVSTAYGGPVDLIDDTCAEMVGYNLTPILSGDGAYPEGEMWAEPDIFEAIAALRRLADDAELRLRLAAAARARIVAQPSSAARGADMWAALQARLDRRGTVGGGRRRAGTAVRHAARAVTSPARGYLNAHFEATKHEFREQIGALARSQATTRDELAGLDELTRMVESLAGTVADMHVHQTRTTLELVDQVRELSDLRADVRTLADAVARLADLIGAAAVDRAAE
ncbi:MAG TPA: glycosyltransferase [Ilumatobacter sp.]|nr:glycosyltransferase [Ilumatobacter sp.]